MNYDSRDIARILKQDLGVENGIRYARKIANNTTDPAAAIAYNAAADKMEVDQADKKQDIMDGYYDLGRYPYDER